MINSLSKLICVCVCVCVGRFVLINILVSQLGPSKLKFLASPLTKLTLNHQPPPITKTPNQPNTTTTPKNHWNTRLKHQTKPNRKNLKSHQFKSKKQI